LGCRRHYRIPSKDMLNKNILLVVKGSSLALSVTKFFKYFPMKVDISIGKYKSKFPINNYDLVLIEDILLKSEFEKLISQTDETSKVQFALIGSKDIDYDIDMPMFFLEKPVTQGSVYNLLIEVFTKNEIEE
jgi:hypothetical protein